MALEAESTAPRTVYDFFAATHLAKWPGHSAGLHLSAHTEKGEQISLWFDYPQVRRMREALVEAEKLLDKEIREWAHRLAVEQVEEVQKQSCPACGCDCGNEPCHCGASRKAGKDLPK